MNKLLAKAGCYNGYTAFKFITRCLWRKEKKKASKKKTKKKEEKVAYTLDQGR